MPDEPTESRPAEAPPEPPEAPDYVPPSPIELIDNSFTGIIPKNDGKPPT